MSLRVPRDEALRQIRKLRSEVLDVLREPKSKLGLLGEIGERGGVMIKGLSDDPELIGRWTELHQAAAAPALAAAAAAASGSSPPSAPTPSERGGSPTTMSGRTAAEEMMRFLEDLCRLA